MNETEKDFVLASRQILKLSDPSSDQFRREFKSLNVVTPVVCSMIWKLIFESLPRCCRHIHLLWALLFLKTYATEFMPRAVTQVDLKTFRKWIWIVIQRLAKFEWGERLNGYSTNGCKASFDGTDFHIQEPSPFSPRWFSHKFNGSGVRYDIGLSIESGRIVWANGPYPCGKYSDDKIFKLEMKKALGQGEKVLADGGYTDRRCLTPKMLSRSDRRFYSVIRARHETLNGRLKRFNVLNFRFRHNLSRYAYCFHAVLNVVQVCLKYDSALFEP